MGQLIAQNQPEAFQLKYNQLTLNDLIDTAIEDLERNGTQIFSCANPHSLTQAYYNHTFYEALEESDYLVVDGVGVELANAVLGRAKAPRITGSDFFHGILSALSQAAGSEQGSKRIFFFGASETTLANIRSRFSKDFPELEYAGHISPPFGQWSESQDEAFIQAINAAKADILWVGMTAPKQELWSQQHRHRLNVQLIGNIGAVFDFYAGHRARAPQWMCQLGIEWMYRLAQEPKRMWQRMVISAPQFCWLAFRHGRR